MKQFDHVCDIKCTGDNSASCGGMPNLVSSYITDISSKLNLFVWICLTFTMKMWVQFT